MVLKNWVKLSDVCDITTGKLDANNAVDGGKYPFFTCAPEPLAIDEFAFDDDVILLAGNNANGTFHIQRYHGRFNAYQRTYVLTAKDGYNIDYIYYSLKLSLVQFQKASQGSQTKFLTKLILNSFQIRYLPFDIQTKLSSVLRYIDDKISNNNAINTELEALAKTIYDYWFLQFEFPNEEGLPYKSSGGRMVWSEELKREIPEGWECVEFQEICDVRRGASPRPIDAFMDPTNTGMPWVKISDATCTDSPFMTVVKECIIRDGVSKSVEVHPGMLIVSNSATPGIPKFIEIDACVHDGWLVLDNYEEEYKYYLYYVVKMIRNSLLNIASGSIFKNLKTDYLKEYNCIKPDGHTLKLYDEKVRIIMEKILLLQKENEELSSLRDFLLPLLMNGQVGFKDTE